jgi:hypothetical protein
MVDDVERKVKNFKKAKTFRFRNPLRIFPILSRADRRVSRTYFLRLHGQLNSKLQVSLLHPPYFTMSLDFLKAEIASKRKLTSDEAARPSKYMRRGELEKIREEQLRKEKEDETKRKAEESLKIRARDSKVCMFSFQFIAYF